MKTCTLPVALGRVLIGAGLCTLAACASMPPNQNVDYYLPKGTTTFTITQTLACDSTNHHLLTTANVVGTTAYSADYKAKQSLPLASFGQGFSDPDLDFNFTTDGRLKGINAGAVGSGSEVI